MEGNREADHQRPCQANDAQLALCSLYANRWYTMKRLHRVCARLGMKAELKVWDQFLIRRTGQRMITFISDTVRLQDGRKVSNSCAWFTISKQGSI